MKKKLKAKILIVISDYYYEISNNLEVGATATLITSHINNEKDDNFVPILSKHEIIKVPGVFEIPVIISKNIKKYDAFIALGCVIKGETPHFNFISQATTDGIMKLSIENKKPIGNGIITALNKNQAENRCGNYTIENRAEEGKGEEAAKAVLSVLKSFS
jgi:6,7-dimethyl-8-ribityllumazine synthase